MTKNERRICLSNIAYYKRKFGVWQERLDKRAPN